MALFGDLLTAKCRQPRRCSQGQGLGFARTQGAGPSDLRVDAAAVVNQCLKKQPRLALVQTQAVAHDMRQSRTHHPPHAQRKTPASTAGMH